MLPVHGVRRCALLLLAAGLVACAPASPRGQPGPAPRLVYFAPAQPADPGLRPYSLDEWRRNGALVVHCFEELRAAVGRETEVIALDAEVLPDVDRAWLRAQAHPPRPRVVVAVNLNLRELQEVLDEPTPWQWAQYWKPGDPHFALVAWGSGCHAAGQERFAAFSPLATFLTAWAERYADCARTARQGAALP